MSRFGGMSAATPSIRSTSKQTISKSILDWTIIMTCGLCFLCIITVFNSAIYVLTHYRTREWDNLCHSWLTAFSLEAHTRVARFLLNVKLRQIESSDERSNRSINHAHSARDALGPWPSAIPGNPRIVAETLTTTDLCK